MHEEHNFYLTVNGGDGGGMHTKEHAQRIDCGPLHKTLPHSIQVKVRLGTI